MSAYLDSRGILTIGFGRTKDVYESMTCTQEQADQWFIDDDLSEHARQLNAVLRCSVTQNQFDAMVSLSYNIGIGNFQQSTVLRCLNQGDVASAADAFLMWDKVDGKEVPGLLRRRQAERNLFLAA